MSEAQVKVLRIAAVIALPVAAFVAWLGFHYVPFRYDPTTPVDDDFNAIFVLGAMALLAVIARRAIATKSSADRKTWFAIGGLLCLGVTQVASNNWLAPNALFILLVTAAAGLLVIAVLVLIGWSMERSAARRPLPAARIHREH